ncbi:family 43 glycosylhydrolase [Aquisphaera insulae]|uniref:family 43 glycosylhydrolase n=1 Tax=Aquisphaera insulae TaxID=2712864 RepID=UPI0013EA0DD2|nr:family 43 glycosylhydrolase [Aquisphaera insulae]
MIMRLGTGLIATLLVTAASTSAAAEVGDFYNIIAPNGADPWVYRHSDGWYYATDSTGGMVVLRRSRTITGLGGAESRVAWRPQRGTPYGREIWAPEIHFLRGRWYIYVAADDGANPHHRMVVLENASPDPFRGEFAFKGKLADPTTDRWAIDGSVLKLGEGDSERLYFVWSGWAGDINVDQRIYIAPMSDPLTISGPRVELSRPSFAWEEAAGPPTINEGPVALLHGGRVFLVYSAAGSWSDRYCLGLLALKPGGDPLDPRAWTKAPEPVFASTQEVIAPGHCSFTKSPDGKEDWLVYHAAKRPGSGWSRSIRTQPFGWTTDGLPDFGRPLSPDRPIPVPSGEPGRLRLEAEAAGLEGGARGETDASCSGGSFVTGLRGQDSRVTFEVNVPNAGDYVAAVRYRGGGRTQAIERYALLVDGRPAGAVSYPDSGGRRCSSTFVRLRLKVGGNRVALVGGLRDVEVDCLDVILDPTQGVSIPARAVPDGARPSNFRNADPVVGKEFASGAEKPSCNTTILPLAGRE